MPTSVTTAAWRSGGRSSTTPSASSTSAAPQAEDAARLPCLTTRAPAAAATIAAMVETLTVLARSPPEPTTSTAGPGTSIGVAKSSIVSARPASSSTVSPLQRSATTNAACCAGVASPLRSRSIAQAVASCGRSWPATSGPRTSDQVRSVGRAPAFGMSGGTDGHVCAGPQQRGDGFGQPERVDRVRDHTVGP